MIQLSYVGISGAGQNLDGEDEQHDEEGNRPTAYALKRQSK